MKKFQVSDRCIACGECVLRTNQLTEDETGHAVPVAGRYIREDHFSEAEEIVSLCPAGALSIVEQRNTAKGGTDGLNELAALLERRLKDVQIRDISRADIEYKETDYDVDHGYVSGEGYKQYPSSGQADRAGREQFEQVYWNHRADYVLSILAQYKSQILRPFYDFVDFDKTYYAGIGRQMQAVLNEVRAEAFSLTNNNLPLPSDFTTFHPELERSFKELVSSNLEHLVGADYVKGFLDELDHEEDCKKKDYEKFITTPSSETVVVVGKHCKIKAKTVYTYEDVNYAGKSLINHIKFRLSFSHKFLCIDEIAENNLQYIMERYRDLVEAEVEKKVREFNAAITQLPDHAELTAPNRERFEWSQ